MLEFSNKDLKTEKTVSAAVKYPKLNTYTIKNVSSNCPNYYSSSICLIYSIVVNHGLKVDAFHHRIDINILYNTINTKIYI